MTLRNYINEHEEEYATVYQTNNIEYDEEMNEYGSEYESEESEQNFVDRNWKRTIVSRVAYLLGISKDHFAEDKNFEPEEYEFMNKDKQARIVRNLCMIRTSIFRNNQKIYNAMMFEFKNLSGMPDYIPRAALDGLYEDGIYLEKSNYKLNNYSIDINNLLKNHIHNCKNLFPSWVNWEYVKPLFIIPNGSTESGIAAASREYGAKRMNLPYSMYINWPASQCGNILYHDGRFMQKLYEVNYDRFMDLSKVKDATEKTKVGIYDYLEESRKSALIVDCENSDPYKLYAMLKNLDQKVLLSKVLEIILFDDFHTTDAWKILEEFTSIPVTYKQIDLIKENKSLVDQTLMITATKMVYRDNIDSFMLAASDSDYWAMMTELPDTRFLVIIEDMKCGPDIKAAMGEKGILYCSLDEFCTGDISDIKNKIFSKELRVEIDQLPAFNIHDILDEAILRTRMQITGDERNAYYKKIVKNLHLVVDDTGNVHISIEQ